jgi:hypothetical protein
MARTRRILIDPLVRTGTEADFFVYHRVGEYKLG